jgi:hypothetical protein
LIICPWRRRQPVGFGLLFGHLLAPIGGLSFFVFCDASLLVTIFLKGAFGSPLYFQAEDAVFEDATKHPRVDYEPDPHYLS